MENQDRAFLEAIVKLADENPDKQYWLPSNDGCDYVEGKAGSCLIGCALLAIGVPAKELEYHNSSYKGDEPKWVEASKGESLATSATGVISSLNKRGLTNITMATAVTAREVQEDQDAGVQWELAASYARLHLSRLN